MIRRTYKTDTTKPDTKQASGDDKPPHNNADEDYDCEPPSLCEDSSDSEDENEPPTLCEDSSDSEDEVENMAQLKGESFQHPVRKSHPHLNHSNSDSDSDSNRGPVKGPRNSATVQKGTPPHIDADAKHAAIDRRVCTDPKTKLSVTDCIFDSLVYRWTALEVYNMYRSNGGKRKFFPEDDGTEEYYRPWSNVQFEEGNWEEDYNNIEPCNWTSVRNPYMAWYLSTHTKPIDLTEIKRNNWIDRRQQLHRQQALPGSHDEHLKQNSHATQMRGIDPRDPDIWDEGRIWRRHMIRKQAAFEVICGASGIYVRENQIDDYLIYLDKENQIEDAEAARTEPQTAPQLQQTADNLVQAAVMMAHKGATRLHLAKSHCTVKEIGNSSSIPWPNTQPSTVWTQS